MLSWGLQYRVVGGAAEDSIDDMDLWREYDRLLRESVWRMPQYPGEKFGVWRVLIDSGWGERSDLVRQFCTARYEQERHETGVRQVHPFAATLLPLKSQSTGEDRYELPVVLRPPQRKRGKRLQVPCLVNVMSQQLKDMIHQGVFRDGKLPEGEAKCNRWPTPPEPFGYTDQWRLEFANFKMETVRNPRTKTVERHWVPKVQARPEEALDCFDEQTEVLTDVGWQLFEKLNGDDCLATVNLETDRIEYQRPQALIAKPYKGDMLAVANTRVDLLVTPGHRMVVYRRRWRDGQTVWQTDTPEIRPARFLTQNLSLKVTGRWEGVPASTVRVAGEDVDARDLAAFLGWYVSEGSRSLTYAKTQGNGKRWRVQIAQHPGPKMDQLVALCRRLPWKEQVLKECVVFTRAALYEYVGQCGSSCYHKRVPPWIKAASPDIIEAFVDAAILGDGWTEKTGHRAYATTSRRLADEMQELFIKLGRTARVSVIPSKPWNIEGRSGQAVEQYHVHERRTRTICLRGKTDDGYGLTVRKVPYDGRVYCATVPNGTLIVRRNGVAVVAGNCRVYALAAAHVVTAGQPLQHGLLRIAHREAHREGARWSDRDRTLLAEAVAELDGARGNNVVGIREG